MTAAGARPVICGGGVIGAAIAYELAQRGHPPLIIESDAIASGASGAAAGTLTPPPPGGDDLLDELRRVSFAMHTDLAATLPAASGVDYAYSLTPRVLIATNEGEAEAARAIAAGSRPASSANSPAGSTTATSAASFWSPRRSSIRTASRSRWSPPPSGSVPRCRADASLAW
jgi:glycine/D-amino acid oxidase-like deaminating enzyme